jgi:hypothetical protein
MNLTYDFHYKTIRVLQFSDLKMFSGACRIIYPQTGGRPRQMQETCKER